MKVWCVFLIIINECRTELEALYEKKEDAEQYVIKEAHSFSPKAEIKITQELTYPPAYSTNFFGKNNNLQYYMEQIEVL